MRRLSSSSYFPCSRVLRSLKERGSAESTAPCRTDLLPQHSSGSGKDGFQGGGQHRSPVARSCGARWQSGDADFLVCKETALGGSVLGADETGCKQDEGDGTVSREFHGSNIRGK